MIRVVVSIKAMHSSDLKDLVSEKDTGNRIGRK